MNSHVIRHWNLNPARLPIPPLPRVKPWKTPFGPPVEARDVGTKEWVFQRSPMLTEPTNRSESYRVASPSGHAENENSLEIN